MDKEMLLCQINMKVLGGVEEGLIFSCGRGLLFHYDYDYD